MISFDQSLSPMTPAGLRALLGDIDIYLFDQILRGRFLPGMRVLDAGCGEGRNIVYLLRAGYDVSGVDRSPGAVEGARSLAARLAPDRSPANFAVAPVEEMPFPDESFDRVVSSAVLHFAADEEHFHAMLREMWRVLRPGGMLFARLASTIGIEERARHITGRRYHLPDGSQRFLVDDAAARPFCRHQST